MDRRPPLEPPPPDAIRLYLAWQAAQERRIELERILPPVAETDTGGIIMPVRDPQLIEADQAESATALEFYRHPWWFGAFSKSEAERVIAEVARATGNA